VASQDQHCVKAPADQATPSSFYKCHKFNAQPCSVLFTTDVSTQPHYVVANTASTAACLHLRPRNMVQLDVGDEVIVLIPEVVLATLNLCHHTLVEIQQRTDTVLLKSCNRITLSECA
jgi:hypothetical protein